MTYDPEICYECTGYGDDYHEDEFGDFVSSCDDCFNNPWRYSDEWLNDDDW